MGTESAHSCKTTVFSHFESGYISMYCITRFYWTMSDMRNNFIKQLLTDLHFLKYLKAWLGNSRIKKVRTKSFTLLLIKAKAVLHLSMFQDFCTVGGSGSEILIQIWIRYVVTILQNWIICFSQQMLPSLRQTADSSPPRYQKYVNIVLYS